MQVGDRVGPYEILEVIAHEARRGEGRYVARRTDDRLCAPVVLELVDATVDAALVSMRLHEAGLACSFAHRSVARLYDLGMAGAHAFLASEYVASATLAELQGRVPLDIAVAIVCEVCAGLDYLHELVAQDGRPLDIVHGQVSPANIFVGCDGSVKLHGGRYVWLPGSSDGAMPRRDRLLYLSPEQCLGRPLDRCSDLYSLAMVLWELTLDVARFSPELSDYEVLTQIAKHDPYPPSGVAPDYPRELERIVLRALQRDPAARHATADELHGELEAFARSQLRYASARDITSFMRRAVPERAARAARLR